MTNIRNAILATLAYYDVFEYPLTSFEIYKYLVNPGRIENKTEGVGDIRLANVLAELDDMQKTGRIIERNGYFFLSEDRSGNYEKRIDREKLSARKWQKLMRVARWFPLVPYVRGILVSGSMAINNSHGESDFDILVITKAGRLYTCRILLSFLTALFGVRRTKDDKIAPDKFCFNHYLTDANLFIPSESLYNAQTYVNLKPVFVCEGVWVKFFLDNLWLNKYVYHFQPQGEARFRTVQPGRLMRNTNAFLEALLNTPIGTLIEKVLSDYQQRRIRLNPVTYSPGGRTVFTDEQLEFHPHSEERKILDNYNKLIENMGTFWNYQEADSGLN
ncbi:MAG: hypothetical protein Q8P35_00725 [Candidatus Yanofskybacteria bacterium]|nr:hypothetical protein [Candidatus Yanofskybacteria bacterium]